MSHSSRVLHVPKYMNMSWQGETPIVLLLIIEIEIFFDSRATTGHFRDKSQEVIKSL